MTSLKTKVTDTRASDAVIARLHKLHPKTIDLSLNRILRLLDGLGNPQEKLPPVFHIAGTNGKGSTGAFLRAMGEAAGLRVHAYTSPHLVNFHERIRLAGQIIDEDTLKELLDEVEAACKGEPITFFEVTTAAALLAFSRVPADFLVLEVGLGGRLDATNVIDRPIASIITPISVDHEQFLGNTITDIAGEKAGIIKNNCPVISSKQTDDAIQVIKRETVDKNSSLFIYDKNWHVQLNATGDTLIYEDLHGRLEFPTPALTGPHQIINAGTAIAAIRHQNVIQIPDAAIGAGLGWVKWPARLQDMTDTSLKQFVPSASRILLDGGHNPSAGQAIYDYLKDFDPVSEPVWLVIGMMARKDIKGYFQPLARLGARVIAVTIEKEEGAAPASEIAASATDVGMNGMLASSVTSALQMIEEKTINGENPIVLIGGSLYLAGEVLKKTGWKAT